MPQQNIKQIKGATQGSVLFLGTNGVVSENNSGLYWDNINNRLGVGTTPSVNLHVIDSTRVTRLGTYSYLNLGINSVIEAQYFTNSISAATSNVSIAGIVRPMGLTTNSLSTSAGVVGLSYWDRETSVSLGNADLLSSAPVLYGTIGQVIIRATGGTVSVVAGVSGVVANQLAGVTVSNIFAFRAAWNNSSANNGYTVNYAAFYMPNETTTAPNIGNKYGIYIDDPNAANIFMGNMAIGTTTSAVTSTYRLTVSGTISTSGFVMSTGAASGYVLTSDANGVATWATASGGFINKKNSDTPHTGTTSPTVIHSFEITPGTCEANDVLKFYIRHLSTNNANSKTVKIWANSSNTISGATTVATYAYTTNSGGVFPFKRSMIFKNSLSSQKIINTTTSHANDEVSYPNNGDATLSLNFNNSVFIFIEVTLADAADTFTMNLFNCKIER